MLLSGLFDALFHSGATLVVTSNCHPEQLYRNGLQRERFLPTINLINQFCQVITIDGDIDHRLTNYNPHYRNYYFSYQKGEQLLADRFAQLSIVNTEDANDVMLHNKSSGFIMINHRQISYIDKTN
jgi:cell division protein ZapE